jgi:hypothetical protein
MRNEFGIHYSLGVGFTPTGDDYCRVAQKAEELGYHSVVIVHSPNLSR